MLILILIDVQYSQNAVFSYEKGSNRQNHSSSPPGKKIRSSKISDPHPPPPPNRGEGIYNVTSYRYLGNPVYCILIFYRGSSPVAPFALSIIFSNICVVLKYFLISF